MLIEILSGFLSPFRRIYLGLGHYQDLLSSCHVSSQTFQISKFGYQNICTLEGITFERCWECTGMFRLDDLLEVTGPQMEVTVSIRMERRKA
jgi:hypothetical protein